MGACNYKPKYTCGDSKTNARCVFYDLPVPEFSNIYEEDCLTTEETTEDIYELISWIKESIDLEDIDIECLEVEKVKDKYFKDKNRFLIKDILEKLIQRECNNSIGGDSNDIPFILTNLDYKCLVDECGIKPGSLMELLQMIINKICE